MYGKMYGKVYGEVDGKLYGKVYGKMYGEVYGKVYGKVSWKVLPGCIWMFPELLWGFDGFSLTDAPPHDERRSISVWRASGGVWVGIVGGWHMLQVGAV